jgi:glycosyltransferase involved in cell wall biosynthesis
VSVVVTCYNLGPFLAEAVDSVLGQSFTDVEILIVDDGSTDTETKAILDTFSRPKTRVLRSEHRGLPGAKNLGTAQTGGELLCFLDAGDVLEARMLARSIAALDAAPSMAFASHWLRTLGADERDWTPSNCDFPALLDMNSVNGSALIRRSAFEAIGGFDETFLDGCDDWDLWITMVEQGHPGTIIPEFLARSRRLVPMRPGLYRRLATKHAASYRAYLEPLLIRREREEAHLKGQIHDLQLDDYLLVTPQLTSARDDVRSAERWRQAEDEAAERETALATAERRRRDAESRCLAAEEAAHQTMDEVAALRRSVSWRLTAPLRAVLGLVRPPKARRR